MPRAEASEDWADVSDQTTPYERAVLASGQTPTTLGGKPLVAGDYSTGPLPSNWAEGQPVIPVTNPYWPRLGPAHYTADMTVPPQQPLLPGAQTPWAGGAAPPAVVLPAAATAAGTPPAGAPAAVGPAAPPAGAPPTAAAPATAAAGTGPLPSNWADVPGAPASMRYAPPSMYTAANPQQQALWQQASTPAGYAALAAAARAPVASPVARAPVAAPRAVAAAPPVVTGPGGAPPPVGNTQGYAGIPGLPGSPSGPSVRGAWAPPVITGPGNPPPPLGNTRGWAGRQGIAGSPSGAASGARNLSDAEIQGMGYGDVGRIVGRPDLTLADRAALQIRLQAMGLGL